MAMMIVMPVIHPHCLHQPEETTSSPSSTLTQQTCPSGSTPDASNCPTPASTPTPTGVVSANPDEAVHHELVRLMFGVFVYCLVVQLVQVAVLSK